MDITRVTIGTAIAWFALAMPCTRAAEQHDTSVIGQWKLTSVLDSAELSALDDDEAAQLVGHVLTISNSKVRIGGQTCAAPDFEATSGDRDEYFKRRVRASAEKLSLPDPVTAVHINCAYVYKQTSNRLVLNWQGVFFEAVRQHAKGKH